MKVLFSWYNHGDIRRRSHLELPRTSIPLILSEALDNSPLQALRAFGTGLHEQLVTGKYKGRRKTSTMMYKHLSL